MSTNIRGRLKALERGTGGAVALVVREYANDTPEAFAERLAAAHAKADEARRHGRQAHVIIVDAPEDETP